MLEGRVTPAAYTWTGAANPPDHAWSNVANWSINGIQPILPPGGNDNVTFPAGNTVDCVQSGTVTINSLTIDKAYDGKITVSQLNIAGGAASTIAGGTLQEGTLHFQAGGQALTWMGGTIQTMFYVDANARMNISPPANVGDPVKSLVGGDQGGAILNSGVITWEFPPAATDIINVTNGGGIENLANSQFNMDDLNGPALSAEFGGPQADGQFRVDAGAVFTNLGPTLSVTCDFSNTGRVTDGNFDLRGGYLLQGSYSGAWLDLGVGPGISGEVSGATFSQGCQVETNSVVAGAATVVVNGTITIAAGAGFTQTDQANLVGSATFNVSGTYTWNSGHMDANGGSSQTHIFPNASLNIGDPNAQPAIALQMVNGWTLYNEGKVTWNAWDIAVGAELQPNPTWTNAQRGIFDIKTNNSVTNTNGEAPTFYNYGTLKKTAGNGTASFDMALFNNGTVGPILGTLRFLYQINQPAQQALIQPQGGTLLADGGFEQDAGSTILQTGDALTVTGTCLFAGGTASLSGGTISATLGVQVQSGATSSGYGSIAADVTNAGQFITGAADGSSTGTISVAGNYTQTGGSTTVNGELHVTGTFEQDGGTTTINSGNPVFTAAAFVQTGGDFQVQNAQNFQVSGNYTMSGGTAEFLYTSATINGQLLINGGTLQLDHVPMVTVSGGVQIGSGGYLQFFGGGISGDVSNAGTLALDTTSSPGGNNDAGIIGNYTQTSTGVLLAAAGPYGYDQLSVNGQASLAGTFELLFADGYDPGPGSVFVPLSYVSRSGTFDGLSLPGLSNGTWDPRYDDPNYPNGFSLWIDS